MRIKTMWKYQDYKLMLAVVLLSVFGLIMVYSASMAPAVMRHETASDYFFQKQKWALMLGMCAFFLFSFVPYTNYMNKKVLQFIFLAMPVPLVLVIFIGHTANNATSWFKVNIFGIQPAEFAKVGLIVYLSGVLANKQKKLAASPQDVLFPLYYVLFICILIGLQPDVGTALIIFCICLAIIASSAASKKLLGKQLLLAGMLSLPFVLIFYDKIFTDERKSRIDGVLHPFEYADSHGFQLVNSYLAISNGGLTGLGLGKSIQKYGYLPEAHTDFIMSVIAEELGLFGVAFVLLLLSFIVLRGLHVARTCDNAFGALLALGISTMIGVQSFVNLGAMTGILPVTGVTLPFVSYGGSSLLSLCIAAGMLVNVSMMSKYKRAKVGKESKGQKNFPSFS